MRAAALASVALLSAVACAGEHAPPRGAVAPLATTAPATTAPATTAAATTAPASVAPVPTVRPTTSAPRPTATTRPAPVPPFRGSAAPIDPATRSRMRYSWRPGCPVPIEDLRILRVDHWTFGGRPARGELVVHETVATAMLRALESLWRARFPIRQMRLVDDFGGSDDRSMAADNTSAFNCRRVDGSSSWSEHAYGKAVDVNPVENPYVTSGGRVDPPSGAPYADRSRRAPGMVHAGTRWSTPSPRSAGAGVATGPARRTTSTSAGPAASSGCRTA